MFRAVGILTPTVLMQAQVASDTANFYCEQDLTSQWSTESSKCNVCAGMTALRQKLPFHERSFRELACANTFLAILQRCCTNTVTGPALPMPEQS